VRSKTAGGTLSAEFEQLLAEFERFQSRIRNVDDRFATIRDMQAELTALEATAGPPDRSVTVVAGPGGSVTDIRFTADAPRLSPQALSAAVMGTLRQAVAEAARTQVVIAEEHLGDDLHLIDQVLETQAELLGTSVEELRSRVRAEHVTAGGEGRRGRGPHRPRRPAPRHAGPATACRSWR
jgi:predicted RecB family endonuclease